MSRKLRAYVGWIGVVAMAAMMAVAGCKKAEPTKGRRTARLVKAAVASFDPNADIVLDLDAYGSERPDDYEVQLAFNQSFDAMDTCVAQHKAGKKIKSETQLRGDMQIAVKLNPKKGAPIAVNAKLPRRYDRSSKLKECIREAVAGVAFPKYDGPPLVAEFETELDAGSEYWED
jgi:hypothetical protein